MVPDSTELHALLDKQQQLRDDCSRRVTANRQAVKQLQATYVEHDYVQNPAPSIPATAGMRHVPLGYS